MTDEEYLKQAVALGVRSVERGGGPFGAVVVKDGVIIGRGSNSVTLECDPTAHAEVEAIRAACRELNSFSLEGATLYASCEPCPMCLSAIYWARVERVVYAATREQAAEAGFDDGAIAGELQLPPAERKIEVLRLAVEADEPFRLWREKPDRVDY